MIPNQYYINNREKCIEQSKQYYKDNKEKVLEHLKTYYQNNCEEIKEKIRQYQKNNYEKIRNREREYKNKKRKMDLKINLSNKTSAMVNYSLKNNKNSEIWDIFKYTRTDLIKRLKKTIPEGYTWEDYINRKLELDHIIPISAFNFTKPEHTDFKRCWTLENLRLLPAKENILKKNKLDRPFQPALLV